MAEATIIDLTSTPEWHAVLKQTRGNATVARQILNMLAEEFPAQCLEIKQHLRNGAWLHAAATVHKIHGSSSFCGLVTLQSRCSALETQLRHNTSPDPPILEAFEQESQRLLQVLDAAAHRQ